MRPQAKALATKRLPRPGPYAAASRCQPWCRPSPESEQPVIEISEECRFFRVFCQDFTPMTPMPGKVGRPVGCQVHLLLGRECQRVANKRVYSPTAGFTAL